MPARLAFALAEWLAASAAVYAAVLAHASGSTLAIAIAAAAALVAALLRDLAFRRDLNRRHEAMLAALNDHGRS